MATWTDLTGTSIIVPAGWTVSEGYGSYSLTGTAMGDTILSEDGETKNFYLGSGSGYIDDNKIYISSYGAIENDQALELKITGGADATNPKLIQWFLANQARIRNSEKDNAIPQLKPFLTGIANAIRTKKGTTAQINAQDFASEIESIEGGGGSATLKGGWTGTPIPVDTTTFVENIYLNTQLSSEEVISLIDNNSSLFDSHMGCIIASTENQSTILTVVLAEGIYGIMDYATEYIYFVYSKEQPEEVIAQFGFNGWNPDFNGTIAFNSINIATTLGILGSAHIEEVVEDFKSLISITCFEEINIELNGTYEGKELVIAENGNTNLLSNIKDNKEIITKVKVKVELPTDLISGLQWKLDNSECADNLFNSMDNIDEIISALDFSNVHSFGSAFYYCDTLTKIKINNGLPIDDRMRWTGFSHTFDFCTKLETIDIKELGDQFAESMFSDCRSLKTIIIRNISVTPVSVQSNAFSRCYHFTGEQDGIYNPNGLKDGRMYVPDNMVATLKSTEGLTDFADIIVPLSTLEE